MSDNIVAIVAIFCVFIGPLWLILHYSTRRRDTQNLTREDEKMLSDLWHLANKMESRVNALETILDSRASGWRDKT
ncbi:MAG: envelope stress response membrane protein PspB [Xanthomonadales bacterium]|nr:envelope stress response membrane protein PspB [Xanthomonadales bacterium]